MRQRLERGGRGMKASVAGRAMAWGTPLAVEAAALLRSVILARLVGAEELGQAMMLALMLRLVEMVSDLGIERLLAQAPDGDGRAFLAALHGAVFLRGLALTGALLILAFPVARAFADGPAASTYAALTLVPLLRGLGHLDYRRRLRAFDYRGLVLVEGGAAGAMLLGAFAGALALGDHRAMLAAVAAQGLAHLALTHGIARLAYRIAFSPEMLARIWRFGAPLIVNAGLLFVTLQADRLIVAAAFGWAQMALYGIAMQLAYMPAQIAGRAASALLAPRYRLALATGALAAEGRHSLLAYLLLGGAFFAGFTLLAPLVIGGVWGTDFVPGTMLAAGLGAAAGLRIARTPLSELFVSMHRTGDPARANLWRAATLPLALAAALAGLPLASLAWSAALGEALAAFRAWQLFTRRPTPRTPEVFA